jgi:hypothetical protein
MFARLGVTDNVMWMRHLSGSLLSDLMSVRVSACRERLAQVVMRERNAPSRFLGRNRLPISSNLLTLGRSLLNLRSHVRVVVVHRVREVLSVLTGRERVCLRIPDLVSTISRQELSVVEAGKLQNVLALRLCPFGTNEQTGVYTVGLGGSLEGLKFRLTASPPSRVTGLCRRVQSLLKTNRGCVDIGKTLRQRQARESVPCRRVLGVRLIRLGSAS